MTQSLYEEIIDAVNARLEAGDIPKAIWVAAIKKVPSDPTMEVWVKAQIRQSIETKGYADEVEITDLAMGDELLQRRLKGLWEELRRRVIEEFVDEELACRVENGSVVEVTMEDGETGYTRKEDA